MPLLSCPESHTEAVEIQKSKKKMEKILKEIFFLKTVYTQKKRCIELFKFDLVLSCYFRIYIL